MWMCAGDGEAAASLCGLSAADRAGGEADLDVVARWLDEGSHRAGRAVVPFLRGRTVVLI